MGGMDVMTVKDRIFLQGLQFFGYHGVLPEERELGQRFTVDLEMAMDLAEAGRTDNLDDTVNYVYI
ncbi:MAG TPA: dihydroneopterin aldolase, partial [Clostridia bacterium]|nr:dihydroneopterin aldolase [Clostridia bacterium]